MWVREGIDEGNVCSGVEALQEKSLGRSESTDIGLSSQQLLCKAQASRQPHAFTVHSCLCKEAQELSTGQWFVIVFFIQRWGFRLLSLAEGLCPRRGPLSLRGASAVSPGVSVYCVPVSKVYCVLLPVS